MIDIHQHLIHGIDDGAQTFEQTQNMLRLAAENGVQGIIATSHAVPGREFFDLPLYMERLQMAQEWSMQNGMGITLYSGAEIFYTDNTVRMLDEQRIPTLNHTRFVLLEFGVRAPYECLISAAEKLTEAEYKPVFAHVERYQCLKNAGHMRNLREKYGVLMQMNANTALNPGGFFRQLHIRHLLQSGMIDAVASDAHNTASRPCRMAQAYDHAAALCGEETAQKLFHEAPMAMLREW